MKTRNWISKVIAVACLTFAVAQVHAFVNTTQSEAVSENTSTLIDRIDLIAAGVDDKSIESEAALTQINEIIDEIDALLDGEPANEGELLDLRDALVDMRLSLSAADASDEQTVGACNSCGGVATPAIGGGGPVFGGGQILSGGGGGFGGGGGIAIGGGGGGIGGFLTSPLGLGAIAGGIVAVTAGGDDDDDVASLGN